MSPEAHRFIELQQPAQLKQRQVPPMQRSPALQAGWPPQVHAPAVLQASARESHIWQVMPAGAHAIAERMVHALSALQQPVVQLAAVQGAGGVMHVPASQEEPTAVHETQALPPAPQVAGMV